MYSQLLSVTNTNLQLTEMTLILNFKEDCNNRSRYNIVCDFTKEFEALCEKYFNAKDYDNEEFNSKLNVVEDFEIQTLNNIYLRNNKRH